jgi:RsiW-degrading membrane proteinase PrsW (M82 family)
MVQLLLVGVIAALGASFLERICGSVLDTVVSPGTRLHTVLFAFLGVAAVEEGMKFWLMKRKTWSHPAFNYRFDGIVYAATVSLGFAAYENILYVLHYGLSVALPRALLAVPGHMSFSVCMGIYYGRAKLCEGWGDKESTKINLWAGYLGSVFLHGFYDACAMTGTLGAIVLFLVFVAVMFTMTYRQVRHESQTDAPV